MIGTAGGPELNLRELEGAISDALAPYVKSTWVGALSASLAGEYMGVATFQRFAVDSVDAAEKEFWTLASEVEIATILALESFFALSDLCPPPLETFRDLGVATAVAFEGKSREPYCAWVAPLIDSAMRDFEDLRARHDELKPVASVLVDHEQAFVDAWRELPKGYRAAGTPFRTYLERVRTSPSQRSLGNETDVD